MRPLEILIPNLNIFVFNSSYLCRIHAAKFCPLQKHQYKQQFIKIRICSSAYISPFPLMCQIVPFFIAQSGTIVIMALSYSLTEDLLQKLKQLNHLFAVHYHQLQQLSEAERLAITHYARISNIGASTRIENALLTDPEVNWLDTLLTEDAHQTAFRKNLQLIENKLSKDRERSIEEVAE